jgi:hypothetical protein
MAEEANVARKIVNLLLVVFLTTVVVVKLTRVLFDVQLAWLYIVALVVVAVGAIVVARRQHRA